MGSWEETARPFISKPRDSFYTYSPYASAPCRDTLGELRSNNLPGMQMAAGDVLVGTLTLTRVASSAVIVAAKRPSQEPAYGSDGRICSELGFPR